MKGGYVGQLLRVETIKPHLQNMVHEYYDVMGWDRSTGSPTQRTLRKVGLV